MLNETELNNLLDHLGTPEIGRDLVLDIRRNAPVRQVRFNGGNVRHRYPSRKMARIIETESRSAEFRANIQYEFDKNVLEYYPQPCCLDVWLHKNDTNKRSRVSHTPDFFLIQRDALWLVEWKLEKKLQKLAVKDPERYVRCGDHWRSPLLEEQLRESGIGYQLRSASEHPALFIQNLQFLAQYLDEDCPSVRPGPLAAIRNQFKKQAVLGLCQLVDAAQEPFKSPSQTLPEE